MGWDGDGGKSGGKGLTVKYIYWGGCEARVDIDRWIKRKGETEKVRGIVQVP